MDRRLVYLFSLTGFFLMWGVFGFAAAAPRGEPVSQVVVVPAESAVINPDAAESTLPVTAEQRTQARVVLYLLHGLGVLLAVVALPNAASKPVTNQVRHQDPPDQN